MGAQAILDQVLGPSIFLPHALSLSTSRPSTIMNTLSLLVLSGLTLLACDAQQLRGLASSTSTDMSSSAQLGQPGQPGQPGQAGQPGQSNSTDFANITAANVTLGATSGNCDTSSWNSHFASDTKACGLQSGGRQPAAGNCATGRFHTSSQCGNCIGNYISCSREHCTMACCLGNCVDSYNCRKCGSDHCTWGLKSCTGGFVPSGYWTR